MSCLIVIPPQLESALAPQGAAQSLCHRHRSPSFFGRSPSGNFRNKPNVALQIQTKRANFHPANTVTQYHTNTSSFKLSCIAFIYIKLSFRQGCLCRCCTIAFKPVDALDIV